MRLVDVGGVAFLENANIAEPPEANARAIPPRSAVVLMRLTLALQLVEPNYL